MRALSRPLGVARGGRLALPLAALALGLALWLWGLGGAERLAAWAAAGQREAQGALARALRALRAGEPGALVALWSLCAAYGVLHAAGPGHGKLVVGAYGVARRVAALRLAGLAVLASLAQGGAAVALVGGGVLALGLTRDEARAAADGGLARLSAVLVGLIGAWLLLRGGRALLRARARALSPGHDHDHDHACGHAHGPDPERAIRATTTREALAVVGAVALRPCSGAVLLLVLTWQMGLLAAGVGGVLAMSLGTAAVTAAAALGAAWLREGALLAAGRGRGLALAAAEALGGALVVAVAWELWRLAA